MTWSEQIDTLAGRHLMHLELPVCEIVLIFSYKVCSNDETFDSLGAPHHWISEKYDLKNLSTRGQVNPAKSMYAIDDCQLIFMTFQNLRSLALGSNNQTPLLSKHQKTTLILKPKQPLFQKNWENSLFEWAMTQGYQVLCHLCSKSISKADLGKYFSKTDMENIEGKLFARKCAECNGEINSQDDFIQNDCGHYYHISCADFINQDRSTAIKICRVKDCNAPLKNLYEKIRLYKENESKKCIYCNKQGQKFLEFDCKHYLCRDCGAAFRAGTNACLEHGHWVKTFCSICQDYSTATRITLNCSHSIDVSKLQYQFNAELRELEIRKKMGTVTCQHYNCDNPLDDVEIFAILGKKNGTKILSYIESMLNDVKSKSAASKSEGKSEEKKNSMEDIYGDISNRCDKCSTERQGYYRFFCKDKFLCKSCITTSIKEIIETSGLKEYCPNCKAATNYYYLKFLIEYSETYQGQVPLKIKEFERKHVKPSSCCKSHYAVKGLPYLSEPFPLSLAFFAPYTTLGNVQENAQF